MKNVVAVLFIGLAVALYGRAFMEDSHAALRARELRDMHRLVPQPRVDEVTIEADEENDRPSLFIPPPLKAGENERPHLKESQPVAAAPSPETAHDVVEIAPEPSAEPSALNAPERLPRAVSDAAPAGSAEPPPLHDRVEREKALTSGTPVAPPPAPDGPNDVVDFSKIRFRASASAGILPVPRGFPPMPRISAGLLKVKNTITEDGKEDTIGVEFASADGQVWFAALARSQAQGFMRGSLEFIEERRLESKERLRERLKLVFERAFDDRDEAVGEYADWFYGFFTSPELAMWAMWGGLKEITSLELDTILDGMSRDVEETMRKEYVTTVLKPALRNPVVVQGIREVLQDAHSDYLMTVQRLDGMLVQFILDNAKYVRPIDTQRKATIKLDWDAESYRAPLVRGDEAAMFGAGGVALVVGSTLFGEVILETFSSVFVGIIGDAIAGAEAAAVGGVLGSEIPIAGTIVGALAGLGVHGVMGLIRENMGREEFVAQTNDALDATITRWQQVIIPNADQLIDRWYNETQQLMVSSEFNRKAGS